MAGRRALRRNDRVPAGGSGQRDGETLTREAATLRRIALAVIAPIAVLAVVGLVWLWPEDYERGGYEQAEQVRGTIVAIDAEECVEERDDDVNGCGTATVEFTEGSRAGESVEAALPNGTGAPEVEESSDVLLLESQTPDGSTWSIVDHQRSTGLLVLALAFALAIVAFGRWRGVTALAGLAVTFGLLLWFVVPAILSGASPVWVALVGSAAIVLVVLYLTHGFSATTTVAVLGTLASLALTGLLALITVSGLHLTGVTDDLSATVGMAHGVDVRGLLLAGIMIGSLGVLDDVTVTQSATVAEIARANPAYRFGELYRAGSRVGRAHIASVINTIVLAYAGSALPLILLIVANNASLGGVVTDQVIAQEIVRSAVATLGIVAAVPMTTALAAFVARRIGVPDEAEEHGHSHAH